jgi:hypothetical protein
MSSYNLRRNRDSKDNAKIVIPSIDHKISKEDLRTKFKYCGAIK